MLDIVLKYVTSFNCLFKEKLRGMWGNYIITNVNIKYMISLNKIIRIFIKGITKKSYEELVKEYKSSLTSLF